MNFQLLTRMVPFFGSSSSPSDVLCQPERLVSKKFIQAKAKRLRLHLNSGTAMATILNVEDVVIAVISE